MDDYNLAPGELVILQNQSVELGFGDNAEELEEVVLTSQNLILVASVEENLFRTRRYLKRCPLDDIVAAGDVPQAIATQSGGHSVLRVAFADESITLHFKEAERATAERWAESIRRAASGNLDAVDTSEVNHSLADDAVEVASVNVASVVGAVGTAFGRVKGGPVGDIATVVGAVGNLVGQGKRSQQRGLSGSRSNDAVGRADVSSKERMPAKTASKCPGCHAPIAGRVGNGVVCPYCDTKFVL